MLSVKLSIADTSRTEYTWAHVEMGSGVDFSNCGAFNFRNLDFEIFVAALLLGCRQLNIPFLLEETKCLDKPL